MASSSDVLDRDQVMVEVKAVEPQGAAAPTASNMNAEELAQLISSFNEASMRLQETHSTLTAEVERLQCELHAANEQLRRSRQLAALGEMAAGIAHEVRNPLGSIGLYAKMLREDLVSMPEQAGIAEKIGDAVRGLDRIVVDVLTFARETTTALRETTIGSVLGAAEAACGPELEAAGVALTFEVGDLAGAMIECDETALRQALVNVMRNARDALCDGADICEGGSVTVLCRRTVARSSEGRSEPMISIIVQDNGPGIPADVQQRMFNPFFTTRAAGTGLGLPIVHRIMDAHGGGVRVRNADDGGAMIELSLPDPDSSRRVSE